MTNIEITLAVISVFFLLVTINVLSRNSRLCDIIDRLQTKLEIEKEYCKHKWGNYSDITKLENPVEVKEWDKWKIYYNHQDKTCKKCNYVERRYL
jgi:hypothetical protein